MTEKTKKRLTIAGVSVLGLALLGAIGMQFAKAPDKPDTLPQSEQGSSSVTPEVQPPDVVVTPPNQYTLAAGGNPAASNRPAGAEAPVRSGKAGSPGESKNSGWH